MKAMKNGIIGPGLTCMTIISEDSNTFFSPFPIDWQSAGGKNFYGRCKSKIWQFYSHPFWSDLIICQFSPLWLLRLDSFSNENLCFGFSSDGTNGMFGGGGVPPGTPTTTGSLTPPDVKTEDHQQQHQHHQQLYPMSSSMQASPPSSPHNAAAAAAAAAAGHIERFGWVHRDGSLKELGAKGGPNMVSTWFLSFVSFIEHSSLPLRQRDQVDNNECCSTLYRRTRS